ncbi:hypothetical protein NFI96_006855 [Prochilodus magdalenae]|nr:hypothetical protein NFI96_006855 [Prochilodus magdalenae]
MAMVKSRAEPRALQASSTARLDPPSLRTHGGQASRLFSVLEPRCSLKMKFSIVEIKGLKDGYHCGYCGGSWGKVSYDRTAPLLRPSALQDMATGGSTYTIVEYFGGDGGHRCGYCKNEMGNFSHGVCQNRFSDLLAHHSVAQLCPVSLKHPQAGGDEGSSDISFHDDKIGVVCRVGWMVSLYLVNLEQNSLHVDGKGLTVIHMRRAQDWSYLTDPTATITDIQRAVVSSMSHPVSAAPSADGCTTQDYMHTDRYHDCP